MRGTSEDLFNGNLATVFGALYRGGAVSRAELGRLTGFNRSTIGRYVAALVELGLADEAEPHSAGGVGRPSPVVELSSEVLAIALNPEIDSLRASLVDLRGAVVGDIREPLRAIPTAPGAVAASAELVSALVAEAKGRVVGIGVAVPGQVRRSDGLVRNAPHLHWLDEPFAVPLAAATGLPVQAANDAALGALAEFEFGAGRTHRHLLYLNGGSSGIGGGVVVGGQLLDGAQGYAGEIGHMRVSSAAIVDSAGIPGTLEAMVTRSELVEVLEASGFDDEQLIARLLADRSQPVRTVVRRQLRHLATGLAAIINIFDPEVVVLGGFLAGLLAYDRDYLMDAVALATLGPSLEQVEIVPSELGTRLLPIGAAYLAFEPLLLAPH